MEINEAINLKAFVTVNDQNKILTIASLNSNIDRNNLSFNFSCNISNKEMVIAHVSEVQSQINLFINNVRLKIQEIEHPISI
jgi:hypothetical protein